MSEKKIKNIFIEGAILPDRIASSIANHKSKTNIGAHSIFLGQVRADKINDKEIKSIEYSAHQKMANKICHEIKEEIFKKYPVSCMHIYHSLGKVLKGEICFFVFVSASHRKVVYDTLPKIVDEIKAKVPIFGKEIFEDESHKWKINQ
tara:strand:+ start:811 stop:1254 length:444 start_codon:yes stop_codon:yes gene_type:complete